MMLGPLRPATGQPRYRQTMPLMCLRTSLRKSPTIRETNGRPRSLVYANRYAHRLNSGHQTALQPSCSGGTQAHAQGPHPPASASVRVSVRSMMRSDTRQLRAVPRAISFAIRTSHRAGSARHTRGRVLKKISPAATKSAYDAPSAPSDRCKTSEPSQMYAALSGTSTGPIHSQAAGKYFLINGLLIKVVPPERLELPTFGLQNHCSTS